MSRLIRLAAPIVVVAAACHLAAASTQPVAGGLRARRAELAAADSALSRLADADARAIGANSTADAVLLLGGLRIVHGRGEVSATLDSLAGASLHRARWTAVRIDVSADGGSGYTLGYGTRQAGDATEAAMRYIAFWRRASSGQWSVAALVLTRGSDTSSSAAPAGCESPSADRAPWFAGGARDSIGGVVRADAAFAAAAAERGPGPAFVAYIAPDGVTMGGAGPLGCGPAALAHAFDGAAPGDLTWAPRLGFVADAGDLGFSVGVARYRGAAGEGTSKYLTIWRRQTNGDWRFVADGGNAAPPDA